VILVIKA